MTPTEYFNQLHVGCDVDWLKTNPGINYYFKARSQGISVPTAFKQRGFDHVRLRVKADMLIAKDADGITLLERIRAVVEDCIAAGLIPILACQGQEFKDSPTPDQRDALISWWNVVGGEFSDLYLDQLAFNLIIETTDGLLQNDAALNDFYAVAFESLGIVDPDRILIICPSRISAPERLPNLIVPNRDRCFVESHFYAAGPSPTNPSKKWTVGTTAERQLLIDKINLVKAWKAKTGIPVWVGAIRFADFDEEDTDSLTSSYSVDEQVTFAAFAVAELKAAGIPFAVNSDTKFHDREMNSWKSVQEPVLDVILG